MIPNALVLRNYRSFASPVRLELRPVTLLFGINNAGKSALLRALPLVSDSIAAASGPLDMESPAARGSSFQDLRWKGIQEDDDPDLGLTIDWGPSGGSPAQMDFALTWFDAWRRLMIRRLSLLDAEGNPTLEASWRPRSEERSSLEQTYEIRHPAEPDGATVRLGFQGLVPALWPEALQSLLKPAVDRLLELSNEVQWLTATRRSPERITPYPSAPRWRMKPDGSDAAAVLAGSPELLAEVSSWYEQHLDRSLRIQEVPPSDFRLMLRNSVRAELDTDLGDNGEGLVQVLPVLTALALARLQGQGPGILAIEEPESHLHPSLQRALAAHLCKVAADNRSLRIVLESHSEHLLLGIQHAILTGGLRPDDAVIYWVRQLDGGQSIAERVTLDQEARLQGSWPPGVFSDDTEMARRIVLARRERAET